MEAPTVVFRSRRRSDCDDRAFVLAAVGIASVISAEGGEFGLEVEAADGAKALAHLQQYESENRPVPPPPPPRPA